MTENMVQHWKSACRRGISLQVAPGPGHPEDIGRRQIFQGSVTPELRQGSTERLPVAILSVGAKPSWNHGLRQVDRKIHGHEEETP